MKFSQVGDGQQFEYQGVVYTRQGPLMGVDNAGNSRMIPRSADVTVIGSTPFAVKAEPDLQQTMTIEKVLNAFAHFEEQFNLCLQNAGSDQPELSSIKQCLSMASKTFKSHITSD
jgi:hypothetical protein